MTPDWGQYRPTGNVTIITAIDAHTAGEPLRIVTGGLPDLLGETILERRRYMREHYDYIRRALMWEPRGHYNMYGCIVTPPVTPEAHLGVLFMHNEGYSTMCGHGVIALVTALLETGAIAAPDRPPQGGPLRERPTHDISAPDRPPQGGPLHVAAPLVGVGPVGNSVNSVPVNLDTPAGLVRATAHLDEQGHVTHVSFLNVPSFLYARDVTLDVPPYGRVTLDVAFGGAFYAVLPVEQVGLRVRPELAGQLAAAATAIMAAVNAAMSITHPFENDLGFLYGTILTDTPEDAAHHSRNVCVFAEAEVDRSPTGTGVTARLALHHAKGQIAQDQEIVIESILGANSAFTGRVVETTQFGPYAAIVPEVSGKAHIVGRSEWMIDPRDEIGRGFLLERKDN